MGQVRLFLTIINWDYWKKCAKEMLFLVSVWSESNNIILQWHTIRNLRKFLIALTAIRKINKLITILYYCVSKFLENESKAKYFRKPSWFLSETKQQLHPSTVLRDVSRQGIVGFQRSKQATQVVTFKDYSLVAFLPLLQVYLYRVVLKTEGMRIV